MRFNRSQIRDIALIFFAALGISKASGDLLTLVFVEPSKDNIYIYSLFLTVLMIALKYYNQKHKKDNEKLDASSFKKYHD